MPKKPRVLVLGAGNCPYIKVSLSPSDIASEGKPLVPFSERFEEVHTIDIDPASKPTYVWDLEVQGWPTTGAVGPFDEIHAYEIFEHLHQQGDYRGFFSLWREIWLNLRLGGLVCATTPWWENVWAWGDPGHKQVYSKEKLTFLKQNEYLGQVGKTPMTDYRAFWPPPYHFVEVAANRVRDSFAFILRKEEWKNDSNQGWTSGAPGTGEGDAAHEVLGRSDAGPAPLGRGIRGDGSGTYGGLQRGTW